MQCVRVLHIVNSLYRAGMESRIMDIYRRLDRERFQFDFYVESGNEGAYDDEVRELGGRVYYSKKKNIANIPSFKQFYRFLEVHREYRIVYAYNQWAGFYLKSAKKAGVPTRIAFARTSLDKKSLKNSIKNAVKKNVNKYATHRFAVSKKAALWLFGGEVVADEKTEVWPNAINSQAFAYSDSVRREMREELELEDKYTVVHVGNIRPEKNHSFLLEVFSEIKKLHENAQLILAGRGGMDPLMEKVRHLNIDGSVHYLGVRDDISRVLQAGDVFIFPSLYEGFPGAVLEAEASGLPCIISDTITDEVMLTDSIVAESLDKSPQMWAEKVNEIDRADRESAWKVVKDKGYDIVNLVDRMQKFFSEEINYTR